VSIASDCLIKRRVCFALQDGHTTVTWQQLSQWEDCPKWDDFSAGPYTAGGTTVSFETPCDYFTTGERRRHEQHSTT